MLVITATAVGGYVAPPPEVISVVRVGFFEVWLTRDTLHQNGVEGKMIYVHIHSLWVARWLFDWTEHADEKKWKSISNFERDANKAFDKKVDEYLRRRKSEC
jgi:hypothetical protein